MMNRLTYKIMVLPVVVLPMTFCSGCSSEANSPETVSYSDISSRESSIIINHVPASKKNGQGEAPVNQVNLTSHEKEVLTKARKQVKSMIAIIEKIVDTDTASQSLQKLYEARKSLQKTRAEIRKTVSNRRKYFLLFASEEGKLLQQAMWSMKKELLRLEGDEEIQAILADGMTNPNENSFAQKERKQFTVTASNVTTSNVSAGDKSTEKSTLVVSEDPAP
jgi:hypothetical protein